MRREFTAQFCGARDREAIANAPSRHMPARAACRCSVAIDAPNDDTLIRCTHGSRLSSRAGRAGEKPLRMALPEPLERL